MGAASNGRAEKIKVRASGQDKDSDDVEEGVVDGARTRLGMTGSGFTAAEEGAGINRVGPFTMLLLVTTFWYTDWQSLKNRRENYEISFSCLRSFTPFFLYSDQKNGLSQGQ